MRSINQKTVLTALEMLGNRVEDGHHKAAEILNKQLIEVPGQTLGNQVPHISRLFPTLEGLERQGLITTTRLDRKRYSVIELVRKEVVPSPYAHLDIPDPSQHEVIIIKALGELGGHAEDPTGQVTVALREIVGEGIPRTQWRQNLEDAEHHGWITRTIANGRAVRISLTDQAWTWYKATYGEAEEPLVEEVDEVDLAGEEELEAMPTLEDDAFAEQVAFKLLEAVIERAKQPHIEASDYERLNQKVQNLTGQVAQLKANTDAAIADKKTAEELFKVASAENDRMTKQVAELMETLDDIAAERDEWRKKYGQLEVQLSALTPQTKKKQMGKELRGLIEE